MQINKNPIFFISLAALLLIAASGEVTKVNFSGVAAGQGQSSGMWLAWTTMVFMLLAVLVVAWQLIFAIQGKPTLQAPDWLDWLFPVLGLAGSGVAIYLTFIETTKAQAICGPVGDCNAVQNSSYAILF